MEDYIDKLAFIDIVNKKILMTMSKGNDTWYIPGGKRDEGESDGEALVREMREETTVEVDLESLELYGVFEAQAHGKPEGVILKMTCYQGEFVGELRPNSEIEKIAYLDYSIYERLGPMGKVVFDDLRGKGLIE